MTTIPENARDAVLAFLFSPGHTIRALGSIAGAGLVFWLWFAILGKVSGI